MTEVTGLVLAGGESRRMGADKAALIVDGRTLLARAVDVLGAFCDPVLVASGDGRRLPGPWHQVDDGPDASKGPIAGLVAGLAEAATPLVAVIAVDLLEPSAPLLRWMAEQWDGASPAVVPMADGHLQPLHAVYAPPALGLLRAALAAGQRSPTRALAAHAQVIPASHWAAVVSPGWAANVNSPVDAAAAGIDVPQSPSGSC